MTNKIFRSVFFTSVLVLLSCLVLVMGALYGFFEKQIKKELESEASYIAYAMENGGENFFDKYNDGDERITLISKDGKVLSDSKADAESMDNHSEREEFKEALLYGKGSSTRYSNTLTEKTVYYAQKLNDGNVLRISTTQYTVLAILIGLLQPLIFILFVILILSFFLSSKVSKNIIKPINEINLENPESCDTYEELSPLLHKILNQQKTISDQVERAQKKQEEFKLITENMSEGFLIIDRYANLLSCNTAALRLLDADEKSGNVLVLNRTSDFRDTVNAALSGKREENIMLHNDRTFNLIANPVLDENKVIGAVIVIIDVTETAKRETIRREFTANVSHELKTPLTSISGFAELMKEGGMPQETVIDFSNSIYTEAQRLITLVSDIIKISELDEKSEQFVWENVDLHEVSEKVIETLKPSADKKNIRMSLIGGSAEVFGVRQIIDEMIYNLCDNAIKYNKENGTVDVIINTDDDKVNISVRDTGIGIASSQQSRVFERFYRVDKSRSKAMGGTGLGLSIVKHGAIYHNADITMESELDKGTVVTIGFKKQYTGK